MFGLPQLGIICFIKTAPDRANPVFVGKVVIAKSTEKLSSIIDVAKQGLKTHGLDYDEQSSFRAFWFGESNWIRDSNALIGKERANFIIVVVQDTIVPLVSISEMTRNIASDPVLLPFLRSAKTS